MKNAVLGAALVLLGSTHAYAEAPFRNYYACGFAENGIDRNSSLLMHFIEADVKMPAGSELGTVSGSLSYLNLDGVEEYTFYVPLAGTWEHTFDTAAELRLKPDMKRITSSSSAALKKVAARIQVIDININPGSGPTHVEAILKTSTGETHRSYCKYF